MTGEVIMARVPSGARFPELHCACCLGLVGPTGRVVWNAGATAQTVMPLAICKDECEAIARRNSPEVELGCMPIARYLVYLAASTATTDVVGELLDQAAYGNFLAATDPPGTTTHANTRGDACQN